MKKAVLRQALAEPAHAVRVFVALIRGWWLKLCCSNFECGRNLRVFGRLDIQGPGRVIFGDDVRVDMTVTPWTTRADAVITVGSGSFLNGTRFGCASAITIGPRAILADARIMDTNFHSTCIDRHNTEAPVRTAPITIGENVWVAGEAGILPGTSIGENSVVGFGAVCSGQFPANVLIAGNPAKVVRGLEYANATASE